VGTAPTPAATVTLPGAPRISTAAVRTRLAGERAETLRMLPRPAQGPALGARCPLPGGQKPAKKPQKKAAKLAKAA
jgi:hypothetical protein